MSTDPDALVPNRPWTRRTGAIAERLEVVCTAPEFRGTDLEHYWYGVRVTSAVGTVAVWDLGGDRAAWIRPADCPVPERVPARVVEAFRARWGGGGRELTEEGETR